MSARTWRVLARVLILAVLSAAVVAVLLSVSDKVHALVVDSCVVLAALIAAWPVLAPPGRDVKEGATERDIESATRDLRIKVSSDELNQRARLLNFADEPAHIRLVAARSLYSYRKRAQPDSCLWHGAFRAFWGSESKRLILLGEPGAGKTLLLLELIRQSAEVLGENHPILMRVNVAQWQTSQTFYDFFLHKLSAERGFPVPILASLLQRRVIIPLLDGFDELDSEESAQPIRGLEIMRRLNSAEQDEYPISAPLVVTCRMSYFKRLEQLQLKNANVVGLMGAGVLELESLNSDRISTFLGDNLRGDAPTRWSTVLDALEMSEPNVVRVLGSPWRLSLALSAYQDGGHPDVLAGKDDDAVEAELLPQFFSITVRRSSQRPTTGENSSKLERQWVNHVASDRSKVAHWLKGIAQHLERDRNEGGGAGELLIYEVYKMANQKVLRAAYGLCALMVVAIAGTAVIVTAFSGYHPFYRIVATCASVAFLGAAAWVAIFRPPSTPAGSSIKRELQTPRGFLDLILSILSALVASVFTLGTVNTPVYRTIGGLCCGLMAGLFFGFVQAKRLRGRGAGLRTSEHPTDPLHGGLESSSVVGGIVAIIYFVVLMVGGAGLAMSTLFCALVLIIFALTNGYPVASISWSRYKLALFILFLQRRLPWRLASFLQWNYDVGLMRTAGLAYQFRHLRMQSWLARSTESGLVLAPVVEVKSDGGTPAAT